MHVRLVAFLGFAAAAAAWSQEPEPPRPPAPAPGVPTPGPRREPPKPVFSPADDPATTPPRPQDPPKPTDAASRPAAPDPVDELFARFAKWPARQGREAADAVSGLGKPVEARLTECLEHNDWRVQAAAAYALGAMGAKAAAPALVRAIREPTNRQSLSELMQALGRVDPERGPDEILPLLGHPSARVRDAALAALPPALDARHAETVARLAAESRGAARAAALELFGRIPGGLAREELFSALIDPETEAAFAACKLLGARADEAGLTRLLGLAREGTLRGSAYAMLALTYAEDRRARRLPLDDDALRLRAVRMLQSDDPFYRSASGCLLANLAYRTEDAALIEIADRYLVPILLDAVAGGVFFADYLAIEELAFRKLELLTGESFGKNAPRWRAWWARSSNGFAARRALKAAGPEDLLGATLVLRRATEDAPTRVVEFAGEAVAAESAARRPILLDAAECARVAKILADAKFFDGGTDPVEDATSAAYVEASVARGARRLDRRRAGAGADLAPVADALFALADELVWQRLAPPDAGARLRWIADRRAEFAALEPDLRADRALDLAVAGYAGFDRDGRVAAAEIARRAPAAARARRAAELAAWLAAETTCGDHAEAVVRLLADAPSAEARDAVFAFVARVPGPRSEAALAEYLARRDLDATVAGFKSKHGVVRAAAARALARFAGASETAPLLLEGLADFEPRVRDACVKSLAEIRDPRVPAMLDAILAGDDRGLRVRAIEALGAVGGDDAAPRLSDMYRSGGLHERAAVVRALEAARGPRAVSALAEIAREAADVSHATEAVLALGRIGGEVAAARVTSLFARSTSRDVRLQCVGALTTILGPRAVPILAPALGDADPVVRRGATLAVGRAGGRVALEPLLKAMEAPSGDAAAEDAFRKLTYFASTQRTPRERWTESRAWADAHGKKPRAEWFRLALESARVEAQALEPRLGGGVLDREGFAVLVRALKSGSPAARDGADALLRRATGLDVPSFPPDADAAYVASRARAYENWAAEHEGELARGLAPDPDAFEVVDAPPPAPSAPESAPAASRPESRG